MSYRERARAATVITLVLLTSALLSGCGVSLGGCGVSADAVHYPPFIEAAQQGDIAEADRLLRSGEMVGQTTIGNQTALHVAAIEGQNEMVVWLLGHEADPLAKDANGKTPVDFARQGGHPDTAQIILDQIQLADDERNAVGSGDISRLRKLLAQDPRGYTALHIFAWQRMTREAAEREIARGADPNARSTAGCTPLHYAMLSGDIEIVRMLLKAGADPNAENAYRETPLTFAAATGELASVKMLLQAGADPSITRAGGETPAQVASRFGHADIADLIEKAREQ